MKRLTPRRALSAAAVLLAGLVVYGIGTGLDVFELGDSTESGDAVADSEAPGLPPGIPDTATAQSQLDELVVEPESEAGSYDRSLFPHWSTVEDDCTARQYVLLRDGTDVETGEDCQPISGSWFSAFDGETSTDIPDTHVDHLVALSEAWRSGAHAWSTERREEFANDIDSPQLWSVTGASNTSKSDHDPAHWMPPRTEVRCDYTKSWISVKHDYELSVDAEEAEALQGHLDEYC
jgi:hypothetical protein